MNQSMRCADRGHRLEPAHTLHIPDDTQDQTVKDLPANPHFAIVGCIGEHNAGDEALFLATVQQLVLRWPGVRITAFSDDAQHTRSSYAVDAVSSVGFLWPRTLIYALRQRSLLPILRTLFECDCLVVCGGELIRTGFGLRATLSIFDRVLMARLLGKRRLFLGVGAGALDAPIQLALMRFAAKGAPVLARESESYHKLASARIGRPVLASDMALHLEPMTPSVRPDETPWCAIVLRDPATTRSCRSMSITREALVEHLARAADFIAADLKLRPVFIAFGRGDDDDRAFHREVRGRMSHPDEATLFETELSVNELLGLVGEASLALAMRLHGSIFAFSRGVPVVGLAYDDKVRKQFSRFGLTEYCLPLERAMEIPAALLIATREAAAISASTRATCNAIRSQFQDTLDAVLGLR